MSFANKYSYQYLRIDAFFSAKDWRFFLRSPLGAPANVVNNGVKFRIGLQLSQQVHAHYNRCEQIVQVVGDAAGQRAETA